MNVAMVNGGNMLYLVGPKNFGSILKKIVLKYSKFPTVLVAAAKPYTTYKHDFLKLKKLFYIDCITKGVGAPKVEEDVTFLENPQDLTSLAISLSQFMNSLPNIKKYVVFDSLNVFFIYNSQNVVLKFVQAIVGKASATNTNIIAIATKSNEPYLSKLCVFFDRTIEL